MTNKRKSNLSDVTDPNTTEEWVVLRLGEIFQLSLCRERVGMGAQSHDPPCILNAVSSHMGEGF